MSLLNKFSDIGIAIVAPGGYAPDEAAFLRTAAALQAQGCRLCNYYQPDKKFQRFGGTDTERLAQLHAAARGPEVQVILALRGGYGMSRLLPGIDFDLLAASGKLLVGHSDFTALQLGLLARTGAPSFAGPMICDDFTRDDVSDFTMEHFLGCIGAPAYSIAVRAPDNPELNVRGKLWGGNLTMLAHLVGTPYFPDVDGGILFVEDVNEHPYRVERMLLQLMHAGVLAKQQALLLGDLSNYRLSEYDNGYDFSAMLSYLRQTLPVPVLTGLPFGHTRDKVTLAVGSDASLISSGSSFTLKMENYIHL